MHLNDKDYEKSFWFFSNLLLQNLKSSLIMKFHFFYYCKWCFYNRIEENKNFYNFFNKVIDNTIIFSIWNKFKLKKMTFSKILGLNEWVSTVGIFTVGIFPFHANVENLLLSIVNCWGFRLIKILIFFNNYRFKRPL